ncbi:hypothetical protein DM02DRAFT_719512 [Periconia macrospinosa]|uniref:Zn(2)-C6 fungal-type domain-containing protein n=1 Tax=Periconia macrospinosa TaxID=97972 RepID=A0A2V1DJL2_9PLEO|nr:hypothetical protein DM02DRAFT_719512 [Periconia macrospinosa]
MVNRGRSGGCITCKGRRIRCDEEKPNCRRCRRHGVECGGYKVNLKFREQNYKFSTVERKIEVGTDVGDRKMVVAVPFSPSAPDTAVTFLLRHYAGYGRNMESGRGFFEVLGPVYRSQAPDSTLSHAVSALASLVSSIWRYGSHGANERRPPQDLYADAVVSLRRAIADCNQVNKTATLLAVLTLQWYENVVAVYGLRLATGTHHDGAISLLSLAEPGLSSTIVDASVRKFVLHIEISSALRRKKPIQSLLSLSLRNNVSIAAPLNPSMALDSIGASIAELQAAHIHSLKGKEELRADAKRIDTQLLAWAQNAPPHWKSVRLTNGNALDSSIPYYIGQCEVYLSCQIANIWNLWRLQRLALLKISVRSFAPTVHAQTRQLDEERMLGETEDLRQFQDVAQGLIDSVCRSVPFYLGNRTAPLSMADFTDPDLSFPSCPETTFKTDNYDKDDRDSDMASDEHKHHIIAQGPWHIMSPLSHLLTLFLEDTDISSWLQPEQYQWIQTQFVRVLHILHILPRAGGGSGAELIADLAKEVRKGAIFMSGP